jgi:hypothetical protein
MIKLELLMMVLNNRLFDYPVLEFRNEVGTCPRLRVRDECRTKQFIDTHLLDDLIVAGVNNGLFTKRAKSLISEIALDHDMDLVFMYSQAIILKGRDE